MKFSRLPLLAATLACALVLNLPSHAQTRRPPQRRAPSPHAAAPATSSPQTQNSPPPQSQAARETMTNDSVIELVRLGLSDTIIIEKIRQSPHNFDTSVAGLRQLKAARVSDALIMVLMNPSNAAPPAQTSTQTNFSASTPNAENSNAAATDDSNPLAPHEPGIYARQGDKLVEINPTTFSGSKANFLGSALTYGLMKTKMRASVRGASANMTVMNKRPEFFFYFDRSMARPGMAMAGFLSFGATSPGEFVLVKMKRKTNTREAVLGEFNFYSSSTGARDKDIVDFSFEKLRPGVFKVTPKADLEPGEYCFYYASTPSGLGFAGGKLFDFSVVATTL